MSGTSMDGIDGALLETDGTEHLIKPLGEISLAYDPAFKVLLKSTEFAIKHCKGDLQQAAAFYPQAIHTYLTNELNCSPSHVEGEIAALATYLDKNNRNNKNQSEETITLEKVIQHSTLLHSIVVKNLLAQTAFTADQIDVIGYHGQAMYHQPDQKISVIVGDGQYLADLTGIVVVNDFRSRDIQLGGQGAPFAPLYHQALAIKDNKIPVAVVNCGGIANVTFINSSDPLALIAFDTGAGNNLIDALVKLRTHGQESMDKDGKYGRKGKVNEQVLKALFDKAILKNGQNYFFVKPPKALDARDVTLIVELNTLSLEDACATLAAFTAESIVKSLDWINPPWPQHWILTGGGWHNPVIRQELNQRLNQKFKDKLKIETADEAGWNSHAMEAQIFAYLAVRSLQNKPLSVPGTTGVPYPVSGGCVFIPSEKSIIKREEPNAT
ncbi:MAG: anhydro-N-acetylmuramic acid kinase [Candidatus Berkiellales bacterium]